LFSASVAHLERRRRQELERRFRFLRLAELSCLPLTERSARIAIDLIAEYIDEGATLKRRLRNAISDFLILGIAIDVGVPLLTRDSALSQFAARRCGSTPQRFDEGVSLLDFARGVFRTRRRRDESKGYVNRQWQVRSMRPTALTS
jgi:predicted nucleic acid-binding protein